MTVTRDGRPVAELCPVNRPRVTAETLLAHWRQLPAVDPTRFRAELDEVLDPWL